MKFLLLLASSLSREFCFSFLFKTLCLLLRVSSKAEGPLAELCEGLRLLAAICV